MILYNNFLGDFFGLKLFPDDPFWTPAISGTPFKENATEFFLIGGQDYILYIHSFPNVLIHEMQRCTLIS